MLRILARRDGQSQRENVGKKGQTEYDSFKVLGAVPQVGKHTDKVITASKKLDVNVRINNNAAIVKRISNDQTEEMMKADQSGVYKITCGKSDCGREVQHPDERKCKLQSKTG